MSLFVFIVLLTIGASFLAAGLIVSASMMASRSTARLADKYPEIYSEEALVDAYHRAETVHRKQKGAANQRQVVTP